MVLIFTLEIIGTNLVLGTVDTHYFYQLIDFSYLAVEDLEFSGRVTQQKYRNCIHILFVCCPTNLQSHSIPQTNSSKNWRSPSLGEITPMQ